MNKFWGFHSTNRNTLRFIFAFRTWSSRHTCNKHTRHVHSRRENGSAVLTVFRMEIWNELLVAVRNLSWNDRSQRRKKMVSLYYILHQTWPSSSVQPDFLSAVKPESELCRAPSVTFTSCFSQPTRTSFIDTSVHKNTTLLNWASDINPPRLLQPWTKKRFLIQTFCALFLFFLIVFSFQTFSNVKCVCFHFTTVCHQTSKEAPLRITIPYLFLSRA